LQRYGHPIRSGIAQTAIKGSIMKKVIFALAGVAGIAAMP
jgi:hypothetical protein